MSHHRDQTAQHRHLVSVVIPCYNEQQRLDTAAIASFLSKRPLARVVLVDDASTDNTFARVTEFAKRLIDQVDVVRLDRNVGKAEAVRAGIRRSLNAHPQFVAYWDADLACPFADIDRLIASALQAPHAIVFSISRANMTRAETAQPVVRFIMSKLFFLLAWRHYLGLSDTQCGGETAAPGTLARPSDSASIPDPMVSRPRNFSIEHVSSFHPVTTMRAGSSLNYQHPPGVTGRVRTSRFPRLRQTSLDTSMETRSRASNASKSP